MAESGLVKDLFSGAAKEVNLGRSPSTCHVRVFYISQHRI